MASTEPTSTGPPRDRSDSTDRALGGPPNSISPYLVMLAMVATAAILIAAYLWPYRDEILEILSQMPT